MLVLTNFSDRCDNGFYYAAGDQYPRAEYEPTKDRISELVKNKIIEKPVKKPALEKADI